MIDHDRNVAQVLECWTTRHRRRTIVIYGTDNGPHRNSLARRGNHAVPQREGHQLGGRFPGAGNDPLARQDQGRTVWNEIVQHHDWLPTFLAAAGKPDVIDKLKKGPRPRPTGKPNTRSTSTGSTCCPT